MLYDAAPPIQVNSKDFGDGWYSFVYYTVKSMSSLQPFRNQRLSRACGVFRIPKLLYIYIYMRFVVKTLRQTCRVRTKEFDGTTVIIS